MNRKEYEILYGKDAVIKCLYVFGLRRYVDYKTGIVGIKRGISWQSLSEEMYVDPSSGVSRRNTGSFHKSRIRRAMHQLEKIGLVKNRSTATRLIFELPFVTRNIFVQSQADIKSTHHPDIEYDIVSQRKNDVLSASFDNSNHRVNREDDIGITFQADTPHISNINNNNYHYHYHSCRFKEFKSIYPNQSNMKQAEAIWKKKKLDKKADHIISDVLKRKEKHKQWLDGYIPNAASYLQWDRWDDEIKEPCYGSSQHISRAVDIDKEDSILRVINSCISEPTYSASSVG